MLDSKKYINLINYLKDMKKVILAFSGGVDSTFLLKVSKETLGNNIKAITIQSPYIPKWEIEEAKHLASKLGIEHEIIEVPIINEIKKNPKDRCYLCKKAVFDIIKSKAEEQEYNYVIDGTNFDDIGDYRPGLKALKELNIRSPLLECKLTKEEIRDLSKKLGLDTWNKPSYACLLTRIPYGDELKVEDFIKIEAAEKYMMKIGFRAVRVRCHGNLARIEVEPADREKLFHNTILDNISKEFKKVGFKYVTLDLEGYRMGSFNETLSKNTQL